MVARGKANALHVKRSRSTQSGCIGIGIGKSTLLARTLTDMDYGINAALEVFHSLPNYNNRFVVKLETRFTKAFTSDIRNLIDIINSTQHEWLTAIGGTLRLSLQALEQDNFTYVGVLGPDAASEALPVAQIAPIYSLAMLGLSSSEVHRNTQLYPLFFRTTAINSEIRRTLSTALDLLDIRLVSTLSSQELAFMERTADFITYCTHQNVDKCSIQQSAIIGSEYDSRIDVRNLIGAYENVDYVVGSLGFNMRYAMCELYKATAHLAPSLRPTFFGMESYDVQSVWNLPIPHDPYLNCTVNELRAAFNGSLFVQLLNIETITNVTELNEKRLHDNLTTAQIKALVHSKIAGVAGMAHLPRVPSVVGSLAYYGYDGAFALLTALYRADVRLERDYGGMRLHLLDSKRNASFFQHFAFDILRDELAATDFAGVTIEKTGGRFRFGPEQSRRGSLIVVQVQDHDLNAVGGSSTPANFVHVGYLDSVTNAIHLNLDLLKFHTPTGEAPHVWRKKYLRSASSGDSFSLNSTTIAIIIIAAVIIVCAAGIIFVWYRKKLQRARNMAQEDISWILPADSIRSEEANELRWTTSSWHTVTTAASEIVQQSSVHYFNTKRVHLRFLPLLDAAAYNQDPCALNSAFDTAGAMQRLAHDNVNRFLGVCLNYRDSNDSGVVHDSSSSTIPAAVFEYGTRGTLRTFILQHQRKAAAAAVKESSLLTLDDELKLNFVADCVRGMCALNAENIVHGFLHTNNVILDNKFTCRITDYGLANYGRSPQQLEAVNFSTVVDGEIDDEDRLLIFRSPERIEKHYRDCTSQRAADVYSVGVLMMEIASGGEFSARLTAEEITKQFQYPTISSQNSIHHYNLLNIIDGACAPPSSPILSDKDSIIFRPLVGMCTRKLPDARPEIRQLYKQMMRQPAFATAVGDGGRENSGMVASMVRRLQNYATNLESIVSERTRALIDESQRTEQLLLQVLPASVAKSLKAGQHVPPESFESLSVHFSDLVGFSDYAMHSLPMQIVTTLNTIYMAFDHVVGQFNVYKVETIGEQYMVVSGLPHVLTPRNRGNDNDCQQQQYQHVSEICQFSLHMLATAAAVLKPLTPLLSLRIGLHCGACVAGVVGNKLPRYCFFGNTINTASRMQSTGVASSIHASDTIYKTAEQYFPGNFHWSQRGEVNVKGLGLMVTYWLQP